MSLILYNSPSDADAIRWARSYAEKALGEHQSGQKLTELIVRPTHDRLITSTGNLPIDEAWIAGHAPDEGGDCPFGSRCSMALIVANARERVDASMAGSSDVEALKKRIPNADEWNWDEKMQFDYIFYHDERAFVVRAANMFLAVAPYRAATVNTPDGNCHVSVCVWPGTKDYVSQIDPPRI